MITANVSKPKQYAGSERPIAQDQIGRRVAAGVHRDDLQKAEYPEQTKIAVMGTFVPSESFRIRDAEQQIRHECRRGEIVTS